MDLWFGLNSDGGVVRDQTLPIPLGEVILPPFQLLSGLLCQGHRCGVVLGLLEGLSEAALEVSVIQEGHVNGLSG